ncbi:hypothetical protein V6N11_083625 [Hibiscus sabdariffa]|uniref:Uncharacterized protein n=3 Tax=Hibiscus sabdariffa TaxID=183260 RepID=A0ABR2A891_9ROSI
MNGLSQLNHAGLLGAVGSTSPPRGGLVLPMETWGPPRHLKICLKMASEGVLLYRGDEHISSHIDDGQCGDRVLRQFNYHQPIPRPPPARQHIHSAHRGRFDENWIVKQADFISVWEERHTRWAEDLSPLQANDFEFDTEYYSWYLENGKPFLVSVEVGNKWREDPRCSKHRQLTSEFGQSFEEPIDDPYDEPNFDRSRVWPSSWDSVEEQPSFGNVWNSVEEQPPMCGGGSSSQHAYTDDGGYIPQMDYTSITGSSYHPEQMHGTPSSQPAYTDDGGYIPQMDYTSITGSSYHPEQMHGTPPSVQVDDQWFNDEQTPYQPRRIVRSPKRYDQTSSLHRQELPRRKKK